MNNLIEQVMHAYYQRDPEALQRLIAGLQVREQSTQRRINALADAIAEHVHLSPGWLRTAITAHFSGKPVPPVDPEPANGYGPFGSTSQGLAED